MSFRFILVFFWKLALFDVFRRNLGRSETRDAATYRLLSSRILREKEGRGLLVGFTRRFGRALFRSKVIRRRVINTLKRRQADSLQVISIFYLGSLIIFCYGKSFGP